MLRSIDPCSRSSRSILIVASEAEVLSVIRLDLGDARMRSISSSRALRAVTRASYNPSPFLNRMRNRKNPPKKPPARHAMMSTMSKTAFTTTDMATDVATDVATDMATIKMEGYISELSQSVARLADESGLDLSTVDQPSRPGGHCRFRVTENTSRSPF